MWIEYHILLVGETSGVHRSDVLDRFKQCDGYVKHISNKHVDAFVIRMRDVYFRIYNFGDLASMKLNHIEYDFAIVITRNEGQRDCRYYMTGVREKVSYISFIPLYVNEKMVVMKEFEVLDVRGTSNFDHDRITRGMGKARKLMRSVYKFSLV